MLPGKCKGKGFFYSYAALTTLIGCYDYFSWLLILSLSLTDKTDYEERSASYPLDDGYTNKCEYEVEESSNSCIPYSCTIIAYPGHLYNRRAVIPVNTQQYLKAFPNIFKALTWQ